MDYFLVVTAAGKSHFVSNDVRSRKQIVRSEKVVTSTGMQSPHTRHKRQQLFLTLAGPLAK
jgi:hypothetical protein